MRIYTFPSDETIIRQVSKDVSDKELESKEFQDWLDQFIKFAKNQPCLAVSAIQVGKPVRVILSFMSPSDGILKKEPTIIINPMYCPILSLGYIEDAKYEGCLSFPGNPKFVNRKVYNASDIFYVDRKGVDQVFFHKTSTGNLFARMIQHELDHLNGVLIVDKEIKFGSE